MIHRERSAASCRRRNSHAARSHRRARTERPDVRSTADTCPGYDAGDNAGNLIDQRQQDHTGDHHRRQFLDRRHLRHAGVILVNKRLSDADEQNHRH